MDCGLDHMACGHTRTEEQGATLGYERQLEAMPSFSPLLPACGMGAVSSQWEATAQLGVRVGETSDGSMGTAPSCLTPTQAQAKPLLLMCHQSHLAHTELELGYSSL